RFGNLFLNTFQQRFKGRECYMVDPYLNDDDFNMEYYKAKNIVPIKSDYKDFIEDYKGWYDLNKGDFVTENTNVFYDTRGIGINRRLQQKLKPFLIPLNNTYASEFI